MIEHYNEEQHPPQAEADECPLALDQVVQHRHDPLQLQEPQQPQDADDARALDQLGKGVDAHLLVGQEGAGNHDEPLRPDDEQVHKEPGPEVLHDDPPVVDDIEPILVVPQEETLRHVQAPEDKCEPVHELRKGCRWRQERHREGNGAHVKADEYQAAKVPTEPEIVVRIDDAGKGLFLGLFMTEHRLATVTRTVVKVPRVQIPLGHQGVQLPPPRVGLQGPHPLVLDLEALPDLVLELRATAFGELRLLCMRQ
mmetsp:Transcript_25766/g.76915  ORF Transcript_25766/g.76915 Transcript_25766/m.76915 type:complete len:254 (+) Transcript_25766:1130-1891(+)